MRFIAYGLLIGVQLVSATVTGVAMSVHDKVIQNSKSAAIKYLTDMLDELELDPFDLPGEQKISRVRVSHIQINPKDLTIKIQNDRLLIHCEKFGASIRGHSRKTKTKWFSDEKTYETFDFTASVKKGGIQLNMEFVMDHQFVNHQTLPFLKLDNSHFILKNDLIDFSTRSQDLGAKIGASLIPLIKLPLVKGIELVMNTSFDSIFNKMSAQSQSESKGEFSTGIFQLFASMIPSQTPVEIPDDLWMSYAMPDDNRAKIENHRMTAYFAADIHGIDKRHHIRDIHYVRDGDLQIDDNGAPFQFQISTKILNQLYEVLMGYNQISLDVTYDQIKAAGFPLDLTTDTMEGAIPDITDYTDYGVELSIRIKNVGAPRFYFSEEGMTINMDLLIEFFDKDYSEQLMSIKYNNITIDYLLQLEDFTMLLDFNTIEMESAHVESNIILNLEETNADEHVTNYFNWASMLIIPWANEYKPKWISSFPIPREVPGFIKIEDISMSIHDNYLSFAIDPEFTLDGPKVHEEGEKTLFGKLLDSMFTQ